MTEQQKAPRKLPSLTLEGSGPFALIGDIHGCVDELRALVVKVEDQTGYERDQITWVSLGDICDRGPDVRGCFRFLKSLKAKKVLGNHDEKLLRYAKGNKVRIGPGQQVSLDSMQKEDFDELRDMWPFIRIPHYNVIAVHGGLHAHVKPEDHYLGEIIRLRFIEPGTTKMYTLAAGDGDKGVFWATVWPGPEHVVFGHAWAEEVQEFPHATGIDTGCVYGNKLTALVLMERGLVSGENGGVGKIIQVPAAREYWLDHIND